MSVMLYPCMLCVALLMCLFVLCVACLGVVAMLLLNIMDVFSVCGGDAPILFLEREWYEGKTQPYRETYYKPILMINVLY